MSRRPTIFRGTLLKQMAGHLAAAALAMMIHPTALRERYDIACGAYAFVLIVILAVAGEDSVPVLAERAWETFLGGALGLTAATLLFPLRTPVSEPDA